MIKIIFTVSYWIAVLISSYNVFLYTINSEYPIALSLIGLTAIAVVAIKFQKKAIDALIKFLKDIKL